MSGRDNVVADCLSRRKEVCKVLTRAQKRNKILLEKREEENQDSTSGEVEGNSTDGEIVGGSPNECPVSGVKLNYGWSEEDLIKEQKEEDAINAVCDYRLV